MYKDIQVISLDMNTSNIGYSIEFNPSYFKGANNLLQKIVKLLFTQKSSSIIGPKYGTEFFNFFKPTTSDKAAAIIGLLPIIIKDVISQIKEIQITDILKNELIPDEEYLLDIKIVTAYYDETKTSWNIVLDVITKQGSIALNLNQAAQPTYYTAGT